MANYENIRPYAELIHTAAQHGGVDSYMEQVADANHELGVMDEKATESWKGLLVAGATLVLWESGKWVYRKGKSLYEKRHKKLEQQSETAKAALIQEIQAAKKSGLVSATQESDNEIVNDTTTDDE